MYNDNALECHNNWGIIVITSKLRNPSKSSKSKISLGCQFVAVSAQSFCSPVEKVGGEGQQTEGDAANNNEVVAG